MAINLPYSDELKIIGEYPATMPGFPGAPKYALPITPRENFNRLIKDRNPMWMPVGGDSLMFCPRIVPDNIARFWVMEKNRITKEEAGGPDWFGVEWEYVDVAGGSMVKPGAPKVPDITRWEDFITFPDLDALDWEASAEANREYVISDMPISMVFFTGFFERLISLMDFENAATALIDEDEQEGVHRLFAALADFYSKLMEKFVKYYGLEIAWFHDDWGAQRSPFFSYATCEEMLIPYIKRMADRAHELGVIFELHSCGKIETLVPLMIEAGVDIWRGQPLNDSSMMVREYGDKLIIGAQVPEVAEDATDEEVYAVAKAFVEEFAPKRATAMLPFTRSKDRRLRDYIYCLSREYYAK